MVAQTMTAQEFAADWSNATIAAERGPVFITSDGKAVHVFLRVEEFTRLRQTANIADLLALPGSEDVELEFDTESPERQLQALN